MVSTAQTRERLRSVDWSVMGRTEFWLEAMWLGALGLVPVLFNYNESLATFSEAKSYAIHFFALLTAVLLLVNLTNSLMAARSRDENTEAFDVIAWLRSDRANLLLTAVLAFSVVYVISTALSQMPSFSFWGLNPASIGYSLYTYLSLIVIFTSIVIYVLRMDQIWRILYLISIVGSVTSVYGISQHFGWDPIGPVQDSSRVFASFGNPIHFGAYLAMSIPITALLILDPRLAARRRLIIVLTIGFALQVAAMWFTGSRGPLVGLVAGLSVALAGVALFSSRERLLVYSAVVLSGVIVAVLIALLPGGETSARSVQFSGELSALTSSQEGGVIQGGLVGRSEIWGDVLELSASWDTFQPDEGVSKVLRPVFGFGPDMFRFSSSLVSAPRTSLELVDHAHNRALHTLAEQGWAGFLAFLSIVLITAWLIFLIGRRLFRERSSVDPALIVVFVAVTAALVGSAVEQLAGVGRLSDLLTSWVLIGLVVVLYRHVFQSILLDRDEPAVVEDRPRRKSGRRRDRRVSEQVISPVAFGVGVVALVGAMAIFVLVDTQILRGSRIVRAVEREETLLDPFSLLLEARDAAPQVELYTNLPANLLLEDSRSLLELGERERAADLAEEAFAMLLDYHERNPLAIQTRIFLAEAAALLVEIGVLDFRDEMVIRYEELALQFPNEASVLAVVANAYAGASRWDDSLAMADRVIDLEPTVGPVPQAWWVKGQVFDRLGRVDESIESFEIAIEKGPDSEFARLSHLELSSIYTGLGDTEQADFHLQAANDIVERAAQ